MFTLNQINDIHNRLGKQQTLHGYLQELNAIGIIKADSCLADGHSEYFGADGQKLIGPAVHQEFIIAGKCNREDFLKHLSLHEQGKTSYLEMSQGLADCGIEKWSFDTSKMTIAYYDREGNELLVESVG
jgi:uncharacterized protein YbcV (DUF1398 family)